MRLKSTLKPTLSFLLMSLFFTAFGQQQNNADLALRALEDRAEEWNLSDSDIQSPLISDMYTSRHNGVTHVYLQQSHEGIGIIDAITTVNIKNGQAFYSTSKFIPQADKKVLDTQASLSVEEAIFSSLKEMGVATSLQELTVKNRSSENQYVFEKPDFSNSDVAAKLAYQMNEKGELVLVWEFTVDMISTADYWSVRTDANSGKIVHKHNYTVYCKHDKHGLKNFDHSCAAHNIADHQRSFKPASAAIMMSNQYNVFVLPTESPIHGPQEIIMDPAILSSSPEGWHSTGTIDYTITRGNNVWAYADANGDNVSDGMEPDGGDSLVFDFPYDSNAEPADLNALAQVNLFYMTNMMHDLSYIVGFTEEAGNFQQNNFGLGGAGGDFVEAEGQDGSGVDNANFATPPDGGNGRMQMFLWNATGGLLRLTDPEQLEGFYDSGTADFGPDVALGAADVQAECIVISDGVTAGGSADTDACTEVMNDLTGKIAIIDRGGCFFSTKVYNAQMRGAVGAIVCNIPGATTAGDDGNDAFGMMGADNAADVTIPSLGVGKNTCDRIKLSLAAEIPVVAHIANHEVEGPDLLDGDFDNGIIAHEFGHGISTRLTGGPAVGCLGGEEQMGEGWSDYFSLVTTVEPGDTGADRRGIGNFATSDGILGDGIRNYPYSTDMDINPTTYDFIKGINIPHGVGEVWCQMLWDMYWAFVDVYGYDADWSNTESGNYRAILLVMDGMKMQPCNPGFVDGRNAILAADIANYGGENQCILWEVFARRGLGFFADQGTSASAGDGTEDFEPRPTCLEELKIRKEMTRFISAGDNVDVTLTMINHLPELAENVIVTDVIPDGLSYIDGTASMDPTVSGNTISFELGDLEFDREMVITYSLISDSDRKSNSIIFQDTENISAANDFFTRDILSEATNVWNVVNVDAFSGSNSWYVADTDVDSDQGLVTDVFTVTGNNPTLKFVHKWNTEASSDGGFVEISVNGGGFELFDDFFENDYSGALNFGTLAIPNLFAFSGLQPDWTPSFADLSAYQGQDVQFRFRLACDDAGSAGGVTPGWLMDDFEVMELLTYTSTACINADNLDEAVCTEENTVFVDSDGISAVVGVDSNHFGLSIFPNPASQQVNLAISSRVTETGIAGIFTIDGKLVAQQQVSLSENEQRLSFDVSSVPTGMYFVKVETNSGAITEKLVIK
jgi:uncharacterized repeat protein (TIGR01451 family)